MQAGGGWGWSNAGLATGEGESLLVDTLFDLSLTATMLAAMGPATERAPIRTLVNTHANGDHCYGNELVTGAEIIASEAARQEMESLPPAMLGALAGGGYGEPLDDYLGRAFGPFRFDDITSTPPTTTFRHRLDVDAGGRRVDLHEVGPAHTAGDVIAHLPDAGVVFTGDILFVYGTPIIWDGPVANWLAACDLIDSLDPAVVVPGHGPLTDATGVDMVRRYLAFVQREATARHQAGLSVREAAFDIDLGEYRDWGDWERIVINVDAVYAELDPGHARSNVMELFAAMAELERDRR
ncbi:MAG: MBL fold metallo-hydrolase [Acidimicrobiia bacterium]|nr:MBL fold metallo-hydrolase [Acidimicrobiia bacterium]MDH5239105.1 MBL fold metallo-hydrolase [Acidimicrobiia bacterium]